MIFSFSATYIALWVIVIFQGLLILALMRQVSDLERGGASKEDLLPIGTAAPSFSGTDERSGLSIELSQSGESGAALIFLSPDCSICTSLADDLGKIKRGGLPPIIAFCKEQGPDSERFAERFPRQFPLLVRGANQVISRYRISTFPTLVMVDASRTIHSYSHPRDAGNLTAICEDSGKTVSVADPQVEVSTRHEVISYE
jgi:hypothetical protein